MAEEAAELCELSSGRALVLTSSYRTLEAVAERLRGQIGHELLVQGEAPRERLLERFREDVSSVLVATGTFWQGVDIPGESLSLLVIDKLPFQPPDDPLVEARCERIRAEGGDWFASYALPSAVLQLRQGFGRLIRSRSDRGVVCLLDPRIRTRPYGRVFLDSCPPSAPGRSRRSRTRPSGAAELRDLGDERVAALDRRLEVRGETGELGDDRGQACVLGDVSECGLDLVVRR